MFSNLVTYATLEPTYKALKKHNMSVSFETYVAAFPFSHFQEISYGVQKFA
jgi:hypothetical protein